MQRHNIASWSSANQSYARTAGDGSGAGSLSSCLHSGVLVVPIMHALMEIVRFVWTDSAGMDAIATYLQPPALHQSHNSPATVHSIPAESLKLREKIAKREAVEAHMHACMDSFCYSGSGIDRMILTIYPCLRELIIYGSCLVGVRGSRARYRV